MICVDTRPEETVTSQPHQAGKMDTVLSANGVTAAKEVRQNSSISRDQWSPPDWQPYFPLP